MYSASGQMCTSHISSSHYIPVSSTCHSFSSTPLAPPLWLATLGSNCTALPMVIMLAPPTCIPYQFQSHLFQSLHIYTSTQHVDVLAPPTHLFLVSFLPHSEEFISAFITGILKQSLLEAGKSGERGKGEHSSCSLYLESVPTER